MDQTFFARSAATLGFVHNHLDRRAAQRDDAAALAQWRAAPGARAIAIAADLIVMRQHEGQETPWFGFEQATDLGRLEATVLLGLDAEGPAFAVLLARDAAPALEARGDLRLANLRALAVEGRVPATDLGALAEAKALLHWHATHRYCANCGAPSIAANAGWRRECPACGSLHFPRTDPVVIMLCVDGDQCLLGRQPRFPPLMYSCLAGFLEPGETIEAAVRREIAEESGIETGRVTYLGSQPWPFPASLMIGCLAEALSQHITVDHEELEDARWFSKDEVRTMFERRHPQGLLCPVPMAIAHHLVRAWVDAEA